MNAAGAVWVIKCERLFMGALFYKGVCVVMTNLRAQALEYKTLDAALVDVARLAAAHPAMHWIAVRECGQ
jgi:hypothetical protein